MSEPHMTYTKTHSAKKKAFLDGISLFFMALFTGYATISILNKDTIDKTPAFVNWLILIVCGFFTLILVYGAISRIHAIFKYRTNWLIHIDSKIIKFSSPSPEEAESFEYKIPQVKKLEKEEYYDGGDTCYKWNMYIEENEGIRKIELELGPFSVEEVVKHIQKMGFHHISFEPQEEKKSLKSRIWSSLLSGIFFLGLAVILGILFALLLMSLQQGSEVFSDAFGFIIDTIRINFSL